MTGISIPPQFTGQAALKSQNAEKFDLNTHSYTPREFTEDDVIIKIECCGVCGSDIHTLTSGWHNAGQFPAIVGHEIIGSVVRAGKNTKHSLGDRVGWGAQERSCGKCANCKAHLEPYCVEGMGGTYQGKTGDKVQPYNQGGYADYFIGRGHFAIAIPEGIESTVAAPLLCAGVTVYSPLKHYGAGPGKKVGIVGIGGLGHLGLQFSAALGAETYAISHSESKKADAEKLGAVGFVATKDPKAAVEQYKGFFDIILCTSFQDDMPLESLYLAMIKPRGNMIIVGLPETGFPGLSSFALLGKSITGSLIGSPAELEEMFDVAVKHNVKTMVETRPMSEATQAVQDMEAGKARYRYVLVN
ncbi:hypothetical protein P7C73_g10, partial [Tremellales sp. Uapishka_1]